MGSSAVQGDLWSTDPAGWADRAERRMAALHEAVLDRLAAGPGTRVLDAGCGAGRCAGLAAERGARATGLDAAPGLVALARQRRPAARFVVGDLERLPFGAGAFDAVIACNSVLYAADPRAALRELARVAAPAGRVVVTAGTGPEQAACAAVVGHLLPPGVEASTHTSLDLGDARAVRAAMHDAGLEVLDRFEVVSIAAWEGVDDAVRAQLPAGPVVAAARHAGAQAVDAALRAFFAARLRPDGTVRVEDRFTCTLAGRRRRRRP